jgi:hypothetical protein
MRADVEYCHSTLQEQDIGSLQRRFIVGYGATPMQLCKVVRRPYD